MLLMLLMMMNPRIQEAAMQAETDSYAEANYAGWKTNVKVCQFNYFSCKKKGSLGGCPAGCGQKTETPYILPNYEL